MNDEILSSAQASELVKLSVDFLTKLARNGEIPAIDMGNRWLFVRDDLLGYMKERARKEMAQRAANLTPLTVEEHRNKAMDTGRITRGTRPGVYGPISPQII